MAVKSYAFKMNDLNGALLALSQGSTYPKIFEEWQLSYVEIIEKCLKAETCVCGHSPAWEICHFYNVKNGNVAIIGATCLKNIQKTEGVPTVFKTSLKIIKASKKIRKDASANTNLELLNYAYDKKILTEGESNSYKIILNKRLLSEDEKKQRVKLNKRIIASISRGNASQQKGSTTTQLETDQLSTLTTTTASTTETLATLEPLFEIPMEKSLEIDLEERRPPQNTEEPPAKRLFTNNEQS